MKVAVGSKNPTKVDAVTDVLKEYKIFEGAKVTGVEVKTEVFGHPNSLQKTVEGAIDRAKQAFVDCEYSFGIEGGLMEVPHTKTGFMEVAVCAIYDGKQYHLGLSPATEWPKKATELIFQGMDGSQALHKIGITEHPKVGTAEGGIWHLTKGRLTRKDLNKMAITMALIHLENPEHF